MSKSSVDSSALAAALVGCVAGLLLIPPGFTWLTSILGLLLLVTLLSYDQEGYRTVLQSVAFAGTCAFCFTVAAILPYQIIYGLPNAQEPVLVTKWLPITWAFATLLMVVVDRARMGARAMTAPAGAASLGSVFTARPTPVPTAAPVWTPPAPAPVPTPVPAPVEPVAPAVHAYQPPRLVREDTHPPAAPTPAPAPAPPANLVEIYVHLTGESLNLMRSVLAEPLGRDYYRITDTMPENEAWQFLPGQVVRCKKQNLSTGKAMVAVEEAPRAQ